MAQRLRTTIKKCPDGTFLVPRRSATGRVSKPRAVKTSKRWFYVTCVFMCHATPGVAIPVGGKVPMQSFSECFVAQYAHVPSETTLEEAARDYIQTKAGEDMRPFQLINIRALELTHRDVDRMPSRFARMHGKVITL